MTTDESRLRRKVHLQCELIRSRCCSTCAWRLRSGPMTAWTTSSEWR